MQLFYKSELINARNTFLNLPFEEVPRAMIKALFRVGRQKKEYMMLLRFAVEKGEHEDAYRQSTIEFVERLFFGPSLAEGKESQKR